MKRKKPNPKCVLAQFLRVLTDFNDDMFSVLRAVFFSLLLQLSQARIVLGVAMWNFAYMVMCMCVINAWDVVFFVLLYRIVCISLKF